VTGIAPYDDKLIGELAARWASVVLRPQADLVEWRTGLDEMAVEYEALRGRGLWTYGRDDFFGILRIGRAELYHSAMLAWLLDPLGRHSLGRRLLDQLVAAHLPYVDSTAFRLRSIDLEVQKQETRADIVVSGDSATIIVEVKVDAVEGHRQCDRLYERFFEEPGSVFVFLTPTGRPPMTATGEALEAFVPISFPQVGDALEVVLVGVDGGVAVDIARNYLRTIRREFG
jgi:hypothetical protein